VGRTQPSSLDDPLNNVANTTRIASSILVCPLLSRRSRRQSPMVPASDLDYNRFHPGPLLWWYALRSSPRRVPGSLNGRRLSKSRADTFELPRKRDALKMRDEFTAATRRILVERAGQHCSNPECGHPTSGPSDEGSFKSTVLGKASHITAAAAGGPRYDQSLTSEQRSSADDGIWLCAECADRVDKIENEAAFPVELLRKWKLFHESSTGTDMASVSNRRRYPLRRLSITDFSGIHGEVHVDFGALTISYGTSKLNRSITEMLRIFGDRTKFEHVRQPSSGNSAVASRLLIGDEQELVVTVTIRRRRAARRLRRPATAPACGDAGERAR
jgi:hypothetical protein